MSADNGVYILRTVVEGGGYEYRVAHLQAIDNYTWDRGIGGHTDDADVHIANAREMWGNAPVFVTATSANEEAHRIFSGLDICEYGICDIRIPRQFTESIDEDARIAAKAVEIRKLAQEALRVQDASNLSGVVQSFAKVMSKLHELCRNESTAFIAHHPVAVMFASKIGDLTGLGGGNIDAFSEAYDECKRLAE